MYRSKLVPLSFCFYVVFICLAFRRPSPRRVTFALEPHLIAITADAWDAMAWEFNPPLQLIRCKIVQIKSCAVTNLAA